MNRQDTDPERGRAVTNETMLRDILLMKQNNVNLIRTSHYPNNARMYAMFDHSDCTPAMRPTWKTTPTNLFPT